jgi:hypothetical protein
LELDLQANAFQCGRFSIVREEIAAADSSRMVAVFNDGDDALDSAIEAVFEGSLMAESVFSAMDADPDFLSFASVFDEFFAVRGICVDQW